MSRITQDIAKQIATKLLEKKKQAIEQALKDYKQFVMDESIKQIPKNVLQFFESNKSYVKKTNRIWLDGYGFLSDRLIIPSYIPSMDEYQFVIKLNATLSAKIMSYKSKHDNLSEEYTKAHNILEQALINCRTFKNVEQNIPEAAPFIPKAQIMALAVNYADVRKLIA